MRVKHLVGMLVCALVALMVIALRPRPITPSSEAAALPLAEKPWLSRAAADQIIGPNGTLGPLFAGITLGGPAPSADIRAHIAAFARANDVHINFEVVDDELTAIRFEVTFGGCCGYEGVDVLAARIGQPRHVGGCGSPTYYYNNWAIAHEDGTHVRGTADVNRLRLRWERTVSFDDVVTRAEDALDSDRGTLASSAGDRWIELESGKRFLLEMPYQFVNDQSWLPTRVQPAERGLQLTTDRRVVTEVTFTFREDRARLKARWGKPRITGANEWMWYRSDRTIVAVFDEPKTTITLARR